MLADRTCAGRLSRVLSAIVYFCVLRVCNVFHSLLNIHIKYFIHLTMSIACFQHANWVGGELNAKTNVHVAMRVP